jgi:putative transposase
LEYPFSVRHVPDNRGVSDLTFFVTARLNTTRRLLGDAGAGQLILDTLNFYRQRGEIECYGFVVMPDHVHLIVKIVVPLTLPRWMDRFKSYVARQLGKGPIWQRGYWSEVVPSIPLLEQKLRYIHENPVRAGLVNEATDHLFSSARDYHWQQKSDRIDDYR